MGGFKLIAIVPFEGTIREFSKNLQFGVAYKFYQDYSITIEENKVVEAYRLFDQHANSQIYELNNNVALNISAVMGRNGSGKSTLFELFYYIIYRISTIDRNASENPILINAVDELQGQRRFLLESRLALAKIQGVTIVDENVIDEFENRILTPIELDDKQVIAGVYMAQLIRKYNVNLDTSKISNEKSVTEEVLRQLKNSADRLGLRIRQAKEKEDEIKDDFNVSLIYENDEGIFEISCAEGKVEHYKLSQGEKSLVCFNPTDFCYTISLNYSHHGLNSQVMGDWITRLFHKNDAYKTPIVISPMRTNGDYEINKELKLSRERLMNSLAYDVVTNNGYKLLDKYTLSKFIFKPKKSPYPIPFGDTDFKGLKSAPLLKRFGVKAFTESSPYVGEAVAYLEEKMLRIDEHYEDLIRSYHTDREEPLIAFILGENTHATKKIRQTLNYLKKITNEDCKDLLPALNDEGEITMTPKDLITYINKFIDSKTVSPIDIIEYSMPGFVSVDFEFLAIEGGRIRLSRLSSGEQQIIFNIHTLLYHIYNLASVHKGKKDKHNKKNEGMVNRPSYKNINIILDEIELYYHPEMQRKLISNLVSNFGRIANLKKLGINSINVCILTHSPFILSDIPLESTLRLEEGIPKCGLQQTFAANIHELLRNDFFLKSFMGDFAKSKITKVIESMEAEIRLKSFNYLPPEGFEHPGYDAEHKTSKLNAEQCEKIIQLVGEPVLEVSLMEMYAEAFADEAEQYIENRLQRIKNNKK